MMDKVLFILLGMLNFSWSLNPGYFENNRYLDVITSGEKIQTQSTNVASAGRTANLGDFYDRRTETFPGYSIYSTSYSKESIHTFDNPCANVDYIRTQSVSEKISKLKIDESLSLTILGGFHIPSGSAGFLKEDRKKFQSAKISLLYSIRTKSEILKIFSKASKSAMDLDLLDKTDATHIVAGIDWGADIVMSVEETNTNPSSKTRVEGRLSGIVGKIAQGIGSRLDIGFDTGNSNEEASSTFSIKFNNDVTSDFPPQTLNDSIKFIRKVPDLIAKVNDGKGKKMNYILIPIDTVRKVMKRESNSFLTQYHEIDEGTLKEAIDLYDDIKNSELLIKDVHSEIESGRHLAENDFSQISTYKSEFKSFDYEMKKNITNLIVNVKMGKQHFKNLKSMLALFRKSDWILDNVMQSLFTYNKTLEKIDTLKLMQSRRFVDKNYQEILTENYMKEIRVISVDLDSLTVSSSIFDRIMELLAKIKDEGIPYYFEDIQDQELILITSYKYGNSINVFDFSINKHEYLLFKDGEGFICIIDAYTNDLVSSYQLTDVADSIVAVEKNRTFYRIDVLTGKIFSTSIESILDHRNIIWTFEGSFPAEEKIIQNNIATNGTEIFFITKSGILYKFDSDFKTTSVLGYTNQDGNFASLVKYKDSIFIQKGTGFYEFNGTDVLTITNMDVGARNNCGLVIIDNKVCRIGGNMTDNYPDPITCYDPANLLSPWSTYGELDQGRHSPAIAYTKLGTVIVGGQMVNKDESDGGWLTSIESFDESFKIPRYLSGSFLDKLKAPQAITFYY